MFKVSVLKRMSFVLGRQTLLRLFSLKMASILALVTCVSSCDNDFEKLEEILARKEKREKELVMIKKKAWLRQQATETEVRADCDQVAALEQALRQARLRQQTTEAELRTARQQVGLAQALGPTRPRQTAEAELGAVRQQVALEQALRQARLRQQTTDVELRTARQQAAFREQALRQAAFREQALRQAAVQEQALRQAVFREQVLRPIDVAAPWKLSAEDAFSVDETECLLCSVPGSFLMYGTCRCPNQRCATKICKNCYWASIASNQTHCAFCRLSRLR
jgi:hypothetical protein